MAFNRSRVSGEEISFFSSDGIFQALIVCDCNNFDLSIFVFRTRDVRAYGTLSSFKFEFGPEYAKNFFSSYIPRTCNKDFEKMNCKDSDSDWNLVPILV